MSRRLKRIAIALVVVAVLAAVAVTLGVTRPWAAPTRTITVQLTAPDGSALTTVDSKATVSLSGTLPNFYRFAGTASDPQYASQYAGPLSGGMATFRNLPAHAKFVVDVSVNHAYTGSVKGDLTVKTGETLAVRLPVVRGGTISGTLVAASGVPLAGIAVGAVDASGHIVHRGTTDSRGRYTIVGLETGSYRVQFNARAFGDTAPDARYAWNYWNSAAEWTDAAPLAVHPQSATRAATDIHGIDGTLAPAPTLTVRQWLHPAVSTFVGSPVYFIAAHSADSVTTQLTNGRQTSVRLAPGGYYIRIIQAGDTSEEDTAFWYAGDGKPPVRSRSRATVYRVVSGTADATIDFGVPRR